MLKPIGTAFIVGAGPENLDLICVRWLTCLRDAEVALHDRLFDLHCLKRPSRQPKSSASSGLHSGNPHDRRSRP